MVRLLTCMRLKDGFRCSELTTLHPTQWQSPCTTWQRWQGCSTGHRAQAQGHELCIISWCSKESTLAYDEAVRAAKLAWLAKHLPSVHWDVVEIVPYGQNKWDTCKSGILFDDEERNRNAWEQGKAFTPETIFATLSALTR